MWTLNPSTALIQTMVACVSCVLANVKIDIWQFAFYYNSKIGLVMLICRGEKDASERIFEAYCKNQARGGQATDGNGNQVKPMTATFVQIPSSVLLSFLSVIDHHKLCVASISELLWTVVVAQKALNLCVFEACTHQTGRLCICGIWNQDAFIRQ